MQDSPGKAMDINPRGEGGSSGAAEQGTNL